MSNKLEEVLSIVPGGVVNNVSIVTPEKIKRNVMLHVSTDGDIKQFIPALTLRGGANENRTITRICTSINILGCFIGYAKAIVDISIASTGKKEDDFYKGGWYIYALPFEYALRPNKKLVYDADDSEEHWLVTYDEETKKYRPTIVGKCFYGELTVMPRSNNVPLTTGNLYIEINSQEPIHFTEEIILEKGYYIIEGKTPDFCTLTEKEEFKVTIISESEFNSKKKLSANLLSFEEPPIYAKW